MNIRTVIISIILFSVNVFGCVTPVYRYALEEWVNDNYRVTVFHKTDSLGDYSEQIEPLLSSSSKIYGEIPSDIKADNIQGNVKANLSIRFVNIEKPMNSVLEQMWKSQRDSEVPWIVIRYPSSSKMMHALWSGPLSGFNLAEKFIDSEARQRINGHLLDGETAVWVLLKTNDEKKNQQAMEVIKNGLEVSRKELKLPQALYDEDVNTLSGTTASMWRISFKVMSISREDEDEVPFISMMLKSEPELMKHLNEPVAFVMYGRCRTLEGIPASELTKEKVVETNRFLLDSCQCQVKEQNPGTDMLIKTDWTDFEKEIAEIKRKEIPLRGITDYVSSNDQQSPQLQEQEAESSVLQVKAEEAECPECAIESESSEKGFYSDPEQKTASMFTVKHTLSVVIIIALAGFGFTWFKLSRRSN